MKSVNEMFEKLKKLIGKKEKESDEDPNMNPGDLTTVSWAVSVIYSSLSTNLLTTNYGGDDGTTVFRGDLVVIVAVTKRWCYVVHADHVGWQHKDDLRIVQP